MYRCDYSDCWGLAKWEVELGCNHETPDMATQGNRYSFTVATLRTSAAICPLTCLFVTYAYLQSTELQRRLVFHANNDDLFNIRQMNGGSAEQQTTALHI